MVTPTLLILAAGASSRYGGLKLVEPVGPGGETIVDYSIYDARRAGFGRVVLIIRGEMEQKAKEWVGARFGKHMPVEYVYQQPAKLPPGFHVPAGRTKPWGTTHAILMAASTIHEPFAVINVGDFYGAESYRALARHLQSGTPDYAVVGFVLRNTLSEFGSVPRAVCQLNDNGYLDNIVEMKGIEREGGHAKNTDAEGNETRLTGNEIVSMNMWGFTPQVFDQLHERFKKFLELNATDLAAECLIPSTVNELIQGGQARVKVLRTADAWFGITYPEDHSRSVESIRRMTVAGYYPKKLW
ncbi:MAG TPA: NTP transferase domain-containing protein [Terracidiphilus sp.]|nr:NTP transferase domain-containing protein [Terracidiphilus sp.]